MPFDPIFDLKPEQLKLHLDLTVSADASNISMVVDEIMKEAQHLECLRGNEVDIEIALREALANAILHGCKSDPGKSVQCVVACDEEHGMLIIVRDPGDGFDPATLPECVVGENIYSDHGRGIFLMNRLMDEVKFSKNGSEIQLRKFPAKKNGTGTAITDRYLTLP